MERKDCGGSENWWSICLQPWITQTTLVSSPTPAGRPLYPFFAPPFSLPFSPHKIQAGNLINLWESVQVLSFCSSETLVLWSKKVKKCNLFPKRGRWNLLGHRKLCCTYVLTINKAIGRGCGKSLCCSLWVNASFNLGISYWEILIVL